MREIDASKARNTFSLMLDQVEAGTQITITRRGKPIAKLVPFDRGIDQKKGVNQADALAAVFRMKELRKGITLGGIAIKDLINDGR
jgi:prevent-host-death family protein